MIFFTICMINENVEDKKAWEDIGFKPLESEYKVHCESRPDILFWRTTQDNKPAWDEVQKVLPKLFVAAGPRELTVPGELLDTYEHQVITGEKLCFTIGSRLEGIMPPPDWEAYRVDGGLPTFEQVKAVAGCIYRYLLNDAHREREEWCGHMSSVVGQM